MTQVMDADIRQVSISLNLDPEAADFPHGLTYGVTGEKPWIAAWYDQLALPNNRYHVL